MKYCAAFLLLDVVSLGANGLLKTSEVPGEVGGWAFQDKDGHHKPVVAEPKSDMVHKPGWAPPAAKVAVAAAKDVSKKSSDHAHVQDSNDALKKMKSSVTKMKVHKVQTKVHSSGDLLGSLAGDCKKNLQLDEFLPKCMEHVDDLIAEIDYDYGDAQLETTLRNYCSHAQEFPKSHGNADGFLNKVSCIEFAEDLWKARVLELKTQKTSGYEDFCTKFYEHHGGRGAVKKSKKKDEPAKYSAASTSSVFFTSVALSVMFVTN